MDAVRKMNPNSWPSPCDTDTSMPSVGPDGSERRSIVRLPRMGTRPRGWGGVADIKSEVGPPNLRPREGVN